MGHAGQAEYSVGIAIGAGEAAAAAAGLIGYPTCCLRVCVLGIHTAQWRRQTGKFEHNTCLLADQMSG